MACTTTISIQTLAYSRVTRPPQKKMKDFLCWGEKLKRRCAFWKRESLQEWTASPLCSLRMEARQQKQCWQRYARRSGRWKNGRRNGHNRSSKLFPKKGNLKQYQNYRTISLIRHPSKLMLRVILSRLKAKAEELLAEEQAGFRPGRGIVEQIFNSHHREEPITSAQFVSTTS